MEPVLILPQEIWDRMCAHVQAAAPQEACGLVGGAGNRAGSSIPVENVLHSETRFRMEPQAQFEALMEIEARGEELLAIFHSHPRGPDHPSATDIAEAFYPGVITLIWFPRHGEWRCRGYLIRENTWSRVHLRIDA